MSWIKAMHTPQKSLRDIMAQVHREMPELEPIPPQDLYVGVGAADYETIKRVKQYAHVQS